MVNHLLVLGVQMEESITINYKPSAKLLPLVLVAVYFKTKIPGFRIIN
jgi:hypothetical protein